MENPDYIIVGAGSAGCVLANRLSKHSSVLLLEAGPKDHGWDFRLHMPAALSHVLSNDTYNWYYQSEPEAHLNNRQVYCPRGRVLGGSSSINGMIFVRGHHQDFDRWATSDGMSSWSYEQCLPYFKLSETAPASLFENSEIENKAIANKELQDKTRRGREGPMKISRGSEHSPLVQAWLKAGQEAGFDRTDDFNGQHQEGLGMFDRTILNGQRLSTARAYLRPATKRNNLSVMTGVLAHRILIEEHKAIGVEVKHQNTLKKLYANKEVILCSGAINSPQLLMLSGIGDADELKAMDIPLVQHLPGVGKNLQDHLELYVQYACKQPVSIYPALKWYNQPAIGIEWYLRKTGLAASNHFEAGAFLRSSEGATYPDLQCHFLPIAMNYDGRYKHNGHGFQVHVGPMKPTSRGSISLRSNDPAEAPRIRFNYNQTETDKSVMRSGIRMVRDIVNQPAFDAYKDNERQPGIDQTSDRALDEFIRHHGESAYHPSCSCKMGYDEMAVVDATARVHNIQNLRIVDASIMPEITNGNLNAPVIMMAEKIAALLEQKAPE